MIKVYNLKTKHRSNKAFSLIELSIVLIIIGFIVSAVIGGKTLMKSARISGARLLTKSSPVSQIEGLVLWLESTYENSFQDANGATVTWSSTVTTWKNKLGFAGFFPSATQSTTSAKPTAIEEGTNKFSVLSFDGTNDTLVTSVTLLDKLTYFLVATKSSSTNAYITGGTKHAATPAILSNWSGKAFEWYNGTERKDIAVTANDKLHIITSRREDDGELDLFFDGTQVQNTTADGTRDLEGFDFSFIGSANGAANFYGGQVAEVILYDRLLTDDEIAIINTYLIQKYNI